LGIEQGGGTRRLRIALTTISLLGNQHDHGWLLAPVAASIATQQSVRRSERIRAGLARRKAEGKPIGGAASKRGKDKQPRRTEGYKQAWARDARQPSSRRNVCFANRIRRGTAGRRVDQRVRHPTAAFERGLA